MAINLKNEIHIEKMRVAGKLAAEVLAMIGEYVIPGVSTDELDRRCFEYITKTQKTIPANVGYRGFPKTLCTSINGVVRNLFRL
jgi:methionyl aminopeptidase